MVSRVEAVVTDLDGTVVRGDGTVSEATLHAAAALRRRGVPLIAATARTPAGLDALRALVPYLDLAVCCSGAVGYAPGSAPLVWCERLDRDVIAELVTMVVELLPEAGLAAFDGSGWQMTAAYQGIRVSGHEGPTSVAELRTVAEVNACALVVVHPELTSQQMIDVLRRGGLATTRIGLHSAGARFVEVTAGRVDKASGVRRALRELGVAPDRAIAFGDMPIDVPMFSAVGRSYAMADAPEGVRAAATATTATVEEDGFAQTLAALGLVP
jgi:Cof subfamily protein (haloacid dehalogenase superfamily)